MRVALVALLAIASPALAEDDEDGPARLSLPTEADRVAWQKTGFRLALGGGYGQLVGLGGAPSGRLLAAKLRVGLQLDARWSLFAAFEYARAREAGGLQGLRFSGTIDPTYHVTPSFAVAIGLGFGGIVEGRTNRPDADPLPATLETSYTFPDASHPIARCQGVGAAGLKTEAPVGNTSRPTDNAGASGDAKPLATAAAHEVTKMPLPQGRCAGTYTEAARAAGLEGVVVLDLVVDETGKARDITVVEGLAHGLTEAAVAALRACRFSPGERGSEKVPVKVRGFKIRFMLGEG